MIVPSSTKAALTDSLQLALLAILDHAQSYEWSVQGFGVLRLFIRGVGRVHLWDSELRYPNVSLIHTHSWDLQSTVVAGYLKNVRYHAYRDESGPGNYQMMRLLTGYQSRPLTDAVPVILTPGQPELYGPGDVYKQWKNEVHSSHPDDGTITVMARREDVNGEAFVFWPTGSEWGTATPRQATSEEVARTVAKAVRRLQEELQA
jgi:hypothetical protein